MLLTGLIYVLLQVTFIGALDRGDLAHAGSWARWNDDPGVRRLPS